MLTVLMMAGPVPADELDSDFSSSFPSSSEMRSGSSITPSMLSLVSVMVAVSGTDTICRPVQFLNVVNVVVASSFGHCLLCKGEKAYLNLLLFSKLRAPIQ